ncbi:hypothetical protein BofuT4_uP070390.1 [Botrytis cinerea T4]|uniref:Uncharacterized protein n=1 Tax=Botryotinia fuckeliana (strain T4) TaxID=999810 RepID=G2XQ75_BOTF4|nr:hypothetical protein BofuT4_uP070390.1 [Botrytis cinerea T4]
MSPSIQTRSLHISMHICMYADPPPLPHVIRYEAEIPFAATVTQRRPSYSIGASCFIGD